MKQLKIKLALMLCTLRALFDRPKKIALANALGVFNEHGIESLFVDPASTSLPFSNRYLLIKRGASGYQYGDICNGGAGGPFPLGPSPDAPYAIGDVMAVRRLGARPGLEMGIAAAGTAVTIDKLLVSAPLGCVQDISQAGVANGTYWVVGRAAATIAATNSTMEVPYVPVDPYQLVNTNGTLTYPTNPV
jgi:hypothetical protein